MRGYLRHTGIVPLIVAAEILLKSGICSVFSILLLSHLNDDLLTFTAEILFDLDICLASCVLVLSRLKDSLFTFAA